MEKPILLAVATLLAAGCAVGPRYQQPAATVPEAYKGLSAEAPRAPESLGDQEWAEVFQDETLRQLIRTALENNYDLQIAAARILQAEAQVGIVYSDEFPTVDGGFAGSSLRTSASRFGVSGFKAFQINEVGIDVTAAWELDFWRKYRSATEAARAYLLASESARQAVIRTLVADVAAAYFELRELDSELEISKRTLATRQDSLDLIRLLADRGLTSLLDVRQAEQLVYTASGTIPDLELQIEQKENQISILLGSLPTSVPRGLALTEQPMSPEVPAGLPSALLERRPDVREAEQRLMALNAEINSVRARAFPTIELTGTSGFRSPSLADLFSGPAGLWNFVGSLTQPIFQKGKLRAGVRLAEAQEQEALLFYQKTVQQAFREVSDALIAYRKTQEFRQQQELLAESARDAARLSNVRYQGGVTNYLEVLTSETNIFTAERGLAQAQLAQRLALVQLYKALGGGWQ
ncbi:MAG: efflux transporter outer membrane subunit [Acidobacteria bacterium]|nr:efflux transporter outer membrane subunit [Acidobacteriota bacterium]